MSRRHTLVPALALAAAITGLLLGLFQGRLPSAGATTLREDAHRLNNLGVAMLERYDYTGAARFFREALAVDASLSLAQHNLAIALYYEGDLADAEASARAAEEALAEAPGTHFVRGLIERATGDTAAARMAFAQVLTREPGDAGAKIHLAQLLAAERRYDEAIALFERATIDQPFNATAVYGLATALVRAGQAGSGRDVMARFERLRADPAAVTYERSYLLEGRLGEALIATGLEPGLVDPTTPAVRFIDEPGPGDAMAPGHPPAPTVQHLGAPLVTGDDDAAGALAASAGRLARGLTLVDLDGDGTLDLLTVTSTGVAIHREDHGRFGVATLVEVPATTPVAVVAGDLDNDGRPDILVVGYPTHRLLYQQDDGTFREREGVAPLPPAAALARAAALADVDHDGDLDMVLIGMARPTWRTNAAEPRRFPDAFAAAPMQVLRNNGNGTFTDISTGSGLATAAAAGTAVVAADFDNRRDVDLLVVPFAGTPALFSNQRDGSFRDVGGDVDWPSASYTSAAAGDVNKDRFTDVFLGRAGDVGVLATSAPSGRLSVAAAPEATRDTRASLFIDYDNDGLLDLVVLTGTGPRLLRRVADGWRDESDAAFPWRGEAALDLPAAMAAGDIDGDGDVDLVVRLSSGRLRVWRNDGGHRQASVAVRLSARVSNRSAIGAVVELRSGSLYQTMATSATTPPSAAGDVVFGLGRRERADVVRVVWPAGILQAETDIVVHGPVAADGRRGRRMPLVVEELDRKPSSCPYLFVWNGSRFAFVTDFLGGGELGYWVAPGVRNVPDPDEYVRIPPGRLAAANGHFDLRITNELEEAVFLDRVELVAVDHPADVEVYPNEGLRSAEGREPFALHTTRGARPPARATDHRGRDVRDRIAALDGRAVDGFRLESIQGYAEEHFVTLEWPAPSGARTHLLLTGWTDYAFSSDNLAAHQAGLTFQPPAVEMRDAQGRWQTVVAEVGLPVGRPQTVVVDLTPILNERAAADGWRGEDTPAVIEVRLVSTLRVYWDRILVDTSSPAPYQLTRIDPAEARLEWRGYSAAVVPEGPAPLTFDYDRVSAHAPWKTMPGRYTREGEVTALLLAVDDRFVVSAPGDQVAVRFPDTLPPPPAGWQRTFLLHADGFSKEMNLLSSSPDAVAPLPYHGMTSYPFSAADAAPRSPEYAQYLRDYNTRVIGGPMPPLSYSLTEAPPATTRPASGVRR